MSRSHYFRPHSTNGVLTLRSVDSYKKSRAFHSHIMHHRSTQVNISRFVVHVCPNHYRWHRAVAAVLPNILHERSANPSFTREKVKKRKERCSRRPCVIVYHAALRARVHQTNLQVRCVYLPTNLLSFPRMQTCFAFFSPPRPPAWLVPKPFRHLRRCQMCAENTAT